MNFWITDPKTGQKSATLTLLVWVFGCAMVKLMMSGLAVGDFKFADFTGTDFATVVSSTGTLYAFRKFTDRNVPADETGPQETPNG